MTQSESYLSGQILIVDDEEANIVLLERMLSRAGYRRLIAIQDSRQVLPLLQETQPDLILLDLLMPHVDGYAILEQLQVTLPAGTYLPVLVLTADITPDALRRALSAGAKDFLTKPFDQTELLLRVKNLLETRYLHLSLQQQLQGLERLNEEAEAAVQLRDESLSTISHDISQPLTGLKFITESLRQALNSKQAPQAEVIAEDLSRIDEAANQMVAMISELSDVARLRMGRELVLQRRRVDLVSLVRREVEAQQKASRRHRIRIEVGPSELVGNWDPVRLIRVLSNLLNNAIKFSPKGGNIDVSVGSISKDSTGWAEISVRDEGLGIPASDLPHIFDRFYRATNVSGHIQGTGIGLSGARQIVEQHGGSISIESEEGRGTTVTVRLPLE